MADGQNFFDQPVRHKLMTYDNIQKLATGQRDHYKTGCLQDCNYFKNYYKIKTIDLSKQRTLDTNTKAIQQINFTGNLARQATIFFIVEEEKETV